MSSHALDTGIGVAVPSASTVTKVARFVLVLALIPVAGLYLLPRVVNLVATPYRLDSAVVYADRYNPALNRIVEHEAVTLAAFDALDRMDAALAEVRATDARVSGELTTLIGQITGDLQATLDSAGGNVTGLVGSLDSLTGRLRALNAPVYAAGAAVAADRAALARILAEARATARKVHSARMSADRSASNVSGS
jgi:hypothetical protein